MPSVVVDPRTSVSYVCSGDPAPGGAPLTLAGLARQVRAVVEHAACESFDLLGFSLGACVAAHLAADRELSTIATLAPGFARHCDLDRRIDLTADLSRIAVPTLVVSASDDQMVPAHHARALAGAIRGARTATLAGSGHLSIYEVPGMLAATVLSFLDE